MPINLNPNDMYNRDSYDPSMYLPEHEKDSSLNLDNQAIREIEKANQDLKVKGEVRNEYRNDRLPYLHRRFFVPLDPINSEAGMKSRQHKKSSYLTVAVVVAWIFIYAGTLNFAQKVLNLNFIWYTLGMLVILATAIYFIWTRLYYKLDEQTMERTRRGDDNERSSISEVWNINPNGIKEVNIDGEIFTKPTYQGKPAIILKLIKQSILTTAEDSVKYHYQGLEKIETILISNNLSYTKFTTKYNTENDEIWNQLDKNLEESSKYGKEYTNLMADMLTYNLNITKSTSTMTAIYYVIYPHYVIKNLKLEDAVRKIIKIIPETRMKVSPVAYKEFTSIIKDYYGLPYLDIDKITEEFTDQLSFQCDVKLLNYISPEGEIIKLKPLPQPTLQNYYPVSPDLSHYYKPASPSKLPPTRVADLFQDKVFRQVLTPTPTPSPTNSNPQILASFEK